MTVRNYLAEVVKKELGDFRNLRVLHSAYLEHLRQLHRKVQIAG
jgi:hypothetical protein